jgi:hypothetical protein
MAARKKLSPQSPELPAEQESFLDAHKKPAIREYGYFFSAVFSAGIRQVFSQPHIPSKKSESVFFGFFRGAENVQKEICYL